MYFDVSAALHDLGNVTDRIVELVEWMKLAEQEHRSPFPSALRPADDLGEDLKATYGWFVSLSANIHEALGRTEMTIRDDQRDRWFRRLEELEKRIDSTGVQRWLNA